MHSWKGFWNNVRWTGDSWKPFIFYFCAKKKSRWTVFSTRTLRGSPRTTTEETYVFSDRTQIVTLYRVHPVYIDPLRYGAPDRHAVSSAVPTTHAKLYPLSFVPACRSVGRSRMLADYACWSCGRDVRPTTSKKSDLYGRKKAHTWKGSRTTFGAKRQLGVTGFGHVFDRNAGNLLF